MLAKFTFYIEKWLTVYDILGYKHIRGNKC